MKFCWDPQKAAKNRRKHGVSFEEASTVFCDPFSLTGADPDHSHGEQRWITFGISESARYLTVAHVDADDMIRVISARRMTKAERVLYEEG